MAPRMTPTLSQQRQQRIDQRERIRRVVLTYHALAGNPQQLAKWEARLRKLKTFGRIMDMESGRYLQEAECTNLS